MASTSPRAWPDPKPHSSAPASSKQTTSEPDWIASQLSLATSELLEIADSPRRSRSSAPPSHVSGLVVDRRLPVSPSLGSLLGEESQKSARLTPVHDDEGHGKGTSGIKILVQGQGAKGKGRAEAEQQAEEDEEDDHLPAARLSYLIASVRPGATSPAPDRHVDSSLEGEDEGDLYEPPPPFLNQQDETHLGIPSSDSATSRAPRRPKSPLDDGVWLNSRGERVVNGQVVGRLSLVRPSAKRGSVDLGETKREEGSDGVDKVEGNRSASSEDSALSRDSQDTLAPELQGSTSSTLAARKRGDPPAFFLELFPAPAKKEEQPLAIGEVESREEGANEESPGAGEIDSLDQHEDEGREVTTTSPEVSSPRSASPLAEVEPLPTATSPKLGVSVKPLTSPSPKPWQPSALLTPSQASSALVEVQRSTPAPVKLHGNRRAADLAAASEAKSDEAGPSRAPRSNPNQAHLRPRTKPTSRAKPSQDGAGGELHRERPVPFLERAAGLFNAGLVPSREEARGTHTSSRPSNIRTRGWADEGVLRGSRRRAEEEGDGAAASNNEEGETSRDRTLEDLEAAPEQQQEEEGEGDDSSLLSLAVSTYTTSSAAPSSFSGSGLGTGGRRLSRSNSGRSARGSVSSSAGGAGSASVVVGGPNASGKRPGHARRRSSAGSGSIASALGLDVEERDEAEAGRTIQDANASKKKRAPTPLFREVKIRGWNLVGDKRKGWICFSVVIVTAQGTSMTLHRRYSSFVSLRSSLISELLDASKPSSRPREASQLVPPLPPRHGGGALGIGLVGAKQDAKHLEKRRMALQKWLQDVLLHHRMGRTESVKSWVVSG